MPTDEEPSSSSSPENEEDVAESIGNSHHHHHRLLDEEEEAATNPQSLFESLYPESIPVVLTIQDLLMPSPSLSGSQLETLHDILDKCLRRVVESRIILAVDREREAMRQKPAR